MKTTKLNFKTIILTVIGIALLAVVAGCSSESDNKTPQQSKQPKQTQSSEQSYSFDHPHDETVTNMEKHKFQHIFANACVEREIRSDPQAKNNQKSIEKSCMCIANYMMEDLTEVEAEKFLDEKKNPRSLQIRFNNASYFCAKNK
jgi:PBP1b-binding outer membrane lipoprotein LpoB